MPEASNQSNWLTSATWGYARFQRGRILCMKLDSEKVVLVEPDGGWMFSDMVKISPTPKPTLEELICTLCNVTPIQLKKIEQYCHSPKNGEQIGNKFSSVEPWRLRKVGVLKDVGRVERKIVSIWNGYSWELVEKVIKEMSDTPTRQINNPK